jgi:hypothetical protein
VLAVVDLVCAIVLLICCAVTDGTAVSDSLSVQYGAASERQHSTKPILAQPIAAAPAPSQGASRLSNGSQKQIIEADSEILVS